MACGHKGLDPLLFAGETRMRPQFGHFQESARQATAQDCLTPVESGLFQFPGQDVGAQRMLLDQVQMSPYEIEQLQVPKPTRRLSVNLQGARSECQTMAAVLQGGHIRVQRFPLVSKDGDPAGRRKTRRYLQARARRYLRMPGHAFDGIGLAQRFEQTDALAIPIEAIDIVEHQGLVTVFVCQKVNAKSGSMAIDPANSAAHRSAKGITLAQAGSAADAAGSLAVLLIWLYYSAQIFLFGAELTQLSGVVIRNDKVTNDMTKTKKLPRVATPGIQGCSAIMTPLATMMVPRP